MKDVKIERRGKHDCLLPKVLVVLIVTGLIFAVSCQQTVYHTVSFNSNGGSAVVSQEVVDGQCAVEPVYPTREGYTFAGWYSDSDLKQNTISQLL